MVESFGGYAGPVRLSWSAAEKWDSCGRKGWFHYADGLREPAKEHLVKGTFVHRVLELTVAEGVDGPDGLRGLARRVFDVETVPSAEWGQVVGEVDELAFRGEAWRHVVNGVEALRSGRLGVPRHVELEINTSFGGVPFIGFVDMVAEVDGGVLRTLDWKTGKVWDMRAGAWRGGVAWNRKKLFQPVLYAQAVEELLGCRVDGGVVVFTGSRPVDVVRADDRLRGEAVDWLGGVWDRVGGFVAAGGAPASTGPLCGWCHFVADCAEGREFVAGRVAAGKSVGGELGWLVGADPGVREVWVELGRRVDVPAPPVEAYTTPPVEAYITPPVEAYITPCEQEVYPGPVFDLAEIRAANTPDPETIEPLPDPTEADIRLLIERELARPQPRPVRIRTLIETLKQRFGVTVPMPEIRVKPRDMDDSQLINELNVELARPKPRKTVTGPLYREASRRQLDTEHL